MEKKNDKEWKETVDLFIRDRMYSYLAGELMNTNIVNIVSIVQEMNSKRK